MISDILITGVGGQGTVLSSRILACAAREKGIFTRTAETLGMAQRGGTVVSHVRLNSEEKGSLVPLAHADLIIAFEPAEAVRSFDRLKKGGKLLVNTHTLLPSSVTSGQAKYDLPSLLDFLTLNAGQAVFLDAQAIARTCGSTKAVNVVLLGAACGAEMLPFSYAELAAAVTATVAPKFNELNQAALQAGFRATATAEAGKQQNRQQGKEAGKND